METVIGHFCCSLLLLYKARVAPVEDGEVSLLLAATLWMISHTAVLRVALVDTVWAAEQDDVRILTSVLWRSWGET